MRDLTGLGFRTALYATGAWMFLTLWSGSATAAERGLLAGAATAGGLAGPVLAAWALAWVWRRRASPSSSPAAFPPAVRHDRGAAVRRLTGTGRGVCGSLVVMMLLMAGVLVGSEGGIIYLAHVRDLVPPSQTAPVAPAVLEALADARHLAGLVEIALFTAFALSFLIAAGLLRNELEACNGHGFRWSWRWTAVSLFIPVVNMVRPWLGLAEIDRAIARATDRRAIPGIFSLPTVAVGIVWLVRYAAELTGTRSTIALEPVTDGASLHAATAAWIDTMGRHLLLDLVVMAVMLWWIWRLHVRIRRL